MTNLTLFISLAILVEVLAAFFIAGRTAILKVSESRVEQLRKEETRGVEKLQKVIAEKAKHKSLFR